MSLQKELKNQTIVIIADNFNPSIFNQYWLINNKFVEEQDIKNPVFTNNVVQFDTENFNILVTQNQLQFSLTNNSKLFSAVLKDTLIPMLEKLTEIPYKAIGINFDWFVKDEFLPICDLTKKLFFKDNSELFKKFIGSNSKFGSYMSMDFDNSRMKLNITPAIINNDVNNETIHFSFNFHIELKQGEAGHKELLESINNWETYHIKSEEIINILR